MDDSGGVLVGLLSSGFMLVLWVGCYVYYGLAFMTIANKTGTENPWMAWVPILNMWLMVQIAQKEAWWMILFFVPIGNLVAMVVITMAIAERVGKPSWWGILTVVPVANLVVPGYLAWG
jgi:hypothetical protein